MFEIRSVLQGNDFQAIFDLGQRRHHLRDVQSILFEIVARDRPRQANLIAHFRATQVSQLRVSALCQSFADGNAMGIRHTFQQAVRSGGWTHTYQWGMSNFQHDTRSEFD